MKVNTKTLTATPVIEDSPVARFFFEDTRMSWLWLIFRLYIGYTWITSGWGKFNNPAWRDTGEALAGFLTNAVKVDPKPVIAFDWYRSFIEMLLAGGHYTWFAKLIIFGELAVGIALILGAFVGVAALAGGMMNWSFMMAGTTSVNPMFFLISVLLILAWKTAGWWGLDRWLLHALGTPWQPGYILKREGQLAK